MVGRVDTPSVIRPSPTTMGAYRSTSRTPPRSALGSWAPGKANPRTSSSSEGNTSPQNIAIGSRTKIFVSVLIIVVIAVMSCLLGLVGAPGEGEKGVVEGGAVDPEVMSDDPAPSQERSDLIEHIAGPGDDDVFAVPPHRRHTRDPGQFLIVERSVRSEPDRLGGTDIFDQS